LGRFRLCARHGHRLVDAATYLDELCRELIFLEVQNMHTIGKATIAVLAAVFAIAITRRLSQDQVPTTDPAACLPSLGLRVLDPIP
jgi:hypothetical protein